MDPKLEAALTALVDKSGFPFQWAVENVVNSTSSQHDWSVETTEHAWENSKKSGFLDLILSHENSFYRIIVECKRPQSGNWIFLVQKASRSTSCIRTRWISGPRPFIEGWYDFYLEPESLQSSVCILRGGDDKAPLIERLCADLLEATDALSAQEKLIFERQGFEQRSVYLPMIVTVARLFVCRLNPAEISLSDGKAVNHEFEEVPMIRFRKSLTSQLTRDVSPQDLQEENFNKERTVLVVNALHLISTLEKIKAARGRPWDWPWGGRG
jgi:hypothetical protein